MAPEQIAGRRGDARTDVYATGTILYEMVTGHLPYDAANPQLLLRAKTEEHPRPPRYYLAGLDASLETIILTAIAPAARDRYASAAELLGDLHHPGRVLARDPQTGRPVRPGLPRLLRRILPPLVLVAILTGLAALVSLSHRPEPSPRHPAADRSHLPPPK